MHDTFSSGQGVQELPAGGQGGGTRGQYFQLWESIGADFQKARRVPQLVDLIKYHHGLVAGPEKKLRVPNHILDGRQIAIEIENLGAKASGQSGFLSLFSFDKICQGNSFNCFMQREPF